MGDFHGKMVPSPRYGDPAPLGGSFVVDCLKGSAVLSTAQHAIPTPEQIEAATRSIAQRPDRQRRDEIRLTLKSVCRELQDLVEASLGASSGDEWRVFWQEHIHEYATLIKTIIKFSSRIGADVVAKVPQVELIDDLTVRFSDAAEELDFLIHAVASASKQVRDFRPVSEKNRDQDFAILARFNYWGANFSMCMFTLDLAASDLVRVDGAILNELFDLARQAALEFNHAVMDAARLRESDANLQYQGDAVGIQIDDDLDAAEAAIARFEG